MNESEPKINNNEEFSRFNGMTKEEIKKIADTEKVGGIDLPIEYNIDDLKRLGEVIALQKDNSILEPKDRMKYLYDIVPRIREVLDAREFLKRD